MKKVLIFIIPLLSISILNSCGPPKPVEETLSDCVPYDLQIEVNDSRMTVAFRNDCNRLTSGYNIYVSEEELSQKYDSTYLPPSVKPHNFTVFPGDTDPDDGIEHYIADGLTNGTLYYVSVRTVFADRSLSISSIEKPVVVIPKGEITLSIRYKGDHDGFSFGTNDYVRADNDLNDLYYLSKDGSDYLCSPTRLDGFLRESDLRVRPARGKVDAVTRELNLEGLGQGSAKLRVNQGDWVSIVTADRYVALCKVTGFSGGGEARQIHLTYLYSARDHAPFF